MLLIGIYVNPYYWLDDHPHTTGKPMGVFFTIAHMDTHDGMYGCSAQDCIHFDMIFVLYISLYTPPKFNSSPLKNDGWKTISYWVSETFQGLLLMEEIVHQLIVRSHDFRGFIHPRWENSPDFWSINSMYVQLLGCILKWIRVGSRTLWVVSACSKPSSIVCEALLTSQTSEFPA